MSTSPKAAHHTPTLRPDSTVTPSQNPSAAAALALNMSWQLLIVIVLPVVGGHLLDTRYHTAPIWMIVGVIVGLVGTIAVVRQTVRQLNDMMQHGAKEPDQK